MTLTLVRREPFPIVPGADALGVPVWAEGRCNAEPLLFMAALADIERDAGNDARPMLWQSALDGAGDAENLARQDLADAFASKGLRYFSNNDEASVGVWTLNGQEIAASKVCRTFWPPFRAAVISGLNDLKEMAGTARLRISAALDIRRAEDAEAQAEEDRQFLNRRIWPPSVAVFWLAFGDIRKAREMADSHSSYEHLQITATVCASVSVQLDADGAGRVNASDPLKAFFNACVQRPGMLEGVEPGKPGFQPIDVRFIEQRALKFHDARMERASAYGTDWTGVCVDRAQLLEAFPPPAVVVMRSVRSLWEHFDRRDTVGALMEEVALLLATVGHTEAEQSDQPITAVAVECSALKPRVGRSPKLREIIKAHAVRPLWDEKDVEPRPADVRARLKASKEYPGGKAPDPETVSRAIEEVREERAAASASSGEPGNNAVIAG